MTPSRPPLRVIAGGARARPTPDFTAAAELCALGLGLVLAVALMARLPSWLWELGRLQGLTALAFAFYALTVARAPRYAALPRVEWVVFAVALATRLLLLPLPPSLSGDLFRYVWEGRVLAHGASPYALGPLAPELAPLRDATIWPGINHKELSTIYPPLAEAGFALVAWLSPTVLAMKAWVVLHDLALVVVLMFAARRAGGSPVGAIAYAWNPLVLVHYAGSGHNDPTAMLWLALAFVLAEGRPVASALCLSAAALVKLVPVLALPFLLRRWPGRARVVAVAVTGAGLAWFWMLTRATYSGLAAYWGTWRNNELVFAYLDRWLGGFGAARVASLALVGAVLAWCWWCDRAPTESTRDGIGAALVTSPVLHPWYLGWVLMFQPLRPQWGWLALSLTVMLNYGVFAPPVEGRSFHLGLAWRWVEFGIPVAVVVALALARRARRAVPEEV